MTLGQLFQQVNEHPLVAIAYFIAILLLSAIVGVVSGKRAAEAPWPMIQSGFIYAVAIPAVFAGMLTLYLFFFERRSIFDTNLVTQIVPIASLLLLFFIISKFLPLRAVPGFNKVGDLVSILALVMGAFWILEKTRIMVFSYMPFQYVLFILIGIVVVLRIVWSRMSR
jgi:hypothetical protein